MADFEKNHPGIAAQELWKLFLRKAEEQGLDRDFISAVGEVCAIGLNLSKYIVRFFPTFTLHDETHSANVCRWMWVLLGEQRAQLTAHEAALLLMAACCHDIGMAVSPEQEEQMRLRTYPGWDDYFRQNLKDDKEYEKIKVISDRMLRNFVRMHHHERIGENLRQSDWPGILNRNGITRETLLKLCRSHGTKLFRLELRSEPKFDLLLCAVLLRLADLLNYDTSRAPAVLFRHMGLDRPANAEEKRSAVEYGNNQAGIFDETIVNDVISYYAEYDNPQQEQEVQGYLDWVTQELKHCAEELAQTGSAWRSLRLPYRINADGVVRNGYAAGKFCMTMDQDKIIDLLTGEKLYSDAGVFVRELLQNSIDAVLMRAKQDPNFSLEDGLIQIDTWMDEEANTWFRIRDNGTGMNEHIIQNHFLKVGNSYYTSEEFQYANRHAPKGSYTAISRFGIGILSCFMGDKEHTQLKVSTKRFDEGTQCGIRLDVTGLHGYYFLCNEKEHLEGENWFPEMPSQNKEDRGYRTEPGTTICVNTNLLRMGELRSFQEILDKYVQFPEVRVTYNGPEGYKEYTTQQELMETVYALNPDGVVKEYMHEIPDEAFTKIKKEILGDESIERPMFVLRYSPVNWLCDTDKLTGISVSVNVLGGTEEWWMWVEETALESVTIRIEATGLDDDEIWFASIKVAVTGENGFLSPQEQIIWNYCFQNVPSTVYAHCRIAYAGVLVTSNNWHVNMFDAYKNVSVLLLRENYLPQVDLARDKITGLSLEATCCMARIPGLWSEGHAPGFMTSGNLLLATERELWELLTAHPDWENHFSGQDVNLMEFDVRGNLTWVMLQVAEWKRNNSIQLNWRDGTCGRDILSLSRTQEPSDSNTADFPAMMFVLMDSEYAKCGNFVFYNRVAPLSQWLIDKREVLIQRVPDVYDQLIRNMVLGSANKTIPQTVNLILSYLQGVDNNAFEIHDTLFLT